MQQVEKKQKSPVKYFGGKGTKLKQILAAFPADGWTKYYEGYGGSGVVLLNKPTVGIEVFNDLSDGLYNLFTTLKSPDSFTEFQRLAECAYYSERIWQDCHDAINDEERSVVERAFAFWYLSRTSFNGVGGFSHATGVVRKGMSKSARDYLAGVEGLPAFHSRWQSVLVMRRDAISLAEKFDRPGWMYYLDPPYVQSTRTSGERYEIDQDDAHHMALVETLLGIKHAKVLVSGYAHDIYKPLVEAGWNKLQFKSPHSEKVETLWANYDNYQDKEEIASWHGDVIGITSST